MTVPGTLPGLPAGLAVRWVAVGLLDEAAAAHARLHDPAHPDALHAFRVALRRLRSTLRAYRDLLHGVVRGKDRRRLRDLARATGEARDAEVQVEWLAARLARARGAERDAVKEAMERARARTEGAGEHLRVAVRDFPRERERLAARLRDYRTELRAGEAPGGTLFRFELASRLRAEAEVLEAKLLAVTDEDHQDEAHQARISLKRLRYLLEPVRDAVPGAREVLRELKALQERLGEMHDAHVMLGQASLALADAEAGDPDAVRGARALRQRLDEERTEHFAALRERWLFGAADAFLARVRGLADELEGGGPEREIERKFLLSAMPRLSGVEAEIRQIEQGYLPGERLAERVRKVRTPAGTRWYRTVKLGSGVSRIEVEEETTERIFRTLWSLTKGRRVRKRRYRVPHGDLVWEIDRFRGQRLVLAEVELPAEDTPVEIPEWLAAVLVREVTGDPAYVNLNLAR
ncbi:MAG TPA: CHAD domain-containing protein [Longimicrobium sp.]